MNTISWMIYLAQISNSFVVICALVAIFFTGLTLLLYWVSCQNEETEKKAWPKAKKCFRIAVCFLIVAVILPTKQTIYLMTASEATELVVTSTQGKQIMDGLIDRLKESSKDTQ